MRVGVLCIQGAFIEHVRMLQSLAESKKGKVRVSVHDVRKPSQLADIDGLIVPGGESTTLSIFLRQNNFEEALKSFVFNEKKPGFMWGTCAGLILLSDELDGQKQGGQITVRCFIVSLKRACMGVPFPLFLPSFLFLCLPLSYLYSCCFSIYSHTDWWPQHSVNQKHLWPSDQ